jgi:hypothetical protein
MGSDPNYCACCATNGVRPHFRRDTIPYMRAGVLFVVGIAGCWRSSEPSSPAVARRAQRDSGPRASVHRAAAKQVDLRDPIVLERALRYEPSLALSTNGPIVVIDLDRGQIDTLCDAPALAAQETWQRLLVEPSRSSPTCTQNLQGLSCMQTGSIPLLVISFSVDPDVHPTRAMIGQPGSARSPTVQQLNAALKNPSCP